MSVTFYPEIHDGDVVTYSLLCEELGEVARAETYRDAKIESDSHGLTCSHCEGYGAQIQEISDVPSVNVANVNALYLLGQLGLSPEDCTGLERDPFASCDLSGSCDASDFLGRVLLAQGLGGPDEGVVSHTLEPGVGFVPMSGPTITDCGRAPGYGDARLEELGKIAQWCVAHGRLVCWA